ncbi:hypothetical protein C0995_010353 [Termitomyces sp. Mi166|nr:hypothetical protein C0995_010353 [Termitomyces sp. Mi166\
MTTLLLFYTALDTSQRPHPHYHYILHLWIGTIPKLPSDLGYGSSSWPITTITSILSVSSNLKSLYIFGLDQNLWCHIEDAIPTNLESLTMGPVHGPFRINDMKRQPRIQNFTSVSSHMRDSEIKDFILSSHCRSFRIILPSLEQLDFSQMAFVPQSKTLQFMEIVICHRDDFLLSGYRARLKEVTNDPRVVMTSLYDDHYHEEWSEFLRHEFLA